MKNKHITLKKVVVARITPKAMQYVKGGGDHTASKYSSVPTTSSESQHVGNCETINLFDITSR